MVAERLPAMNGTNSFIVQYLGQYAQDVESFISGPIAFLKTKQKQAPNTVVVNALVFLTISAALSAFLEVHPDDSAKPQNLWQHA